ncbi:MAG TPA: hypothetical protein VF681_11320 [Abditibacteriaceae bacterium]|jgi:hypothetical protein
MKNSKYGRIAGYLGVLLLSASSANAQLEKRAPVFELPAGIDDILAIKDEPLLIQATETPQIAELEDEEAYSLISVEAQMILLAQTETETKVYVPKHIPPHVFVRLFGGINIPTRLFVAPLEQR